MTIEEATSIKISETVKTTILDNGLSIAKNRAILSVTTRANTVLDNGLTIDQNSGIKQSQTKHSKEWKDTVGKEAHRKAGLTLKNKPLVKCPHCEIQSNSMGNLKRWHFDNCKNYKGLIDSIV